MAVAKSEGGRVEPVLAFGIHHERAPENLGPIASVGAGIHPDPASCRARDRARKLEAAETCCASSMECHGVRGPAACDQHVADDPDGGELAGELDDQRVDAAVRDEEIRTESDRHDRKTMFARPGQRVPELGDRLGSPECTRGPSCSNGRVTRERNLIFDVHPRPSRISGTARSTSPAPIVAIRSPSRARASRNATPSSSRGVHASGIPGRSSLSRSCAEARASITFVTIGRPEAVEMPDLASYAEDGGNDGRVTPNLGGRHVAAHPCDDHRRMAACAGIRDHRGPSRGTRRAVMTPQ